MFVKRVHVFRSGDQTSAQGVQRTFSPQDLQQVVDTYDPSTHEAPLVLGHQGDNDSLPSFGWIKGFSRQGENLYADVAFTDAAKDLVKDGHYRKVSISFYSPDSVINPHKGQWSARHLALLGASPPAVKGLEPFSFAEREGVYDFAVTLTPGDIFDDQLGPTLIVDKSPLEMLQEKLAEVRQDVSSAVQDLKQSNQQQSATETAPSPEDGASSDSSGQEYAEMGKKTRAQTTEITQQTADLEDQFPSEEQFMEDKKISRKHANGAHGQVMQVVENVYDEMDDDHGELPPALKKHAAEVKSQGHFAEDESDPEFDEVSYKTNPSPGVVKLGKKFESDEYETGRYETARSTKNGYADRMVVGKEGKGGVGEDRMNTAKSGEQEADRLNTAKNGEQEVDRKKTAKDASDNATGESRWAGQADAEERYENGDQYDVDEASYGVNKPKTASGANPAGREDSYTKVPTETEETPDDEVFAVGVANVMSDKDMRVLRQKSSDGRKATKGGAIDHGEPEEDETTSEMGVTAMGEKKSKKGQLSGEFEGECAETVGPDGAYAEVRGEKKSSDKHLTPGAFDEIDEADQTVGPDGAFSEDDLSGDFEGGPNQKTKRSGGVFSEEHGEKKNPYTKTGFGSTYGEDDEDEDEDDFAESSEYCGMGSASQAKSMGAQMYEELKKLKAEHAELQRRYSEEKVCARKQKMASFVEALYEEGRLTDGVMPQSQLLRYCEGLDLGTLEFSEGETAATKLIGLLSKLPPMVTYGEVTGGGSFQYAEEDLDPHAAALRMVQESDGKIDYVEAIKRTMFN